MMVKYLEKLFKVQKTDYNLDMYQALFEDYSYLDNNLRLDIEEIEPF